jgi:hypothetical protein
MLAADLAAAETIDALQRDANGILPQIASERRLTSENSEPIVSMFLTGIRRR